MNLIVVVDENWAIGKDGDQLCYISADLKRFRSLTTGHAVILGRKTLATFPGGRPLKNRRNLILSRNAHLQIEGGEMYHSLEKLLENAPEDAFVIGGSSVYEALLDSCDTAYITKIHGSYPADCYFPNLDKNPAWQVFERSEDLEEDGVFFHYETYHRA